MTGIELIAAERGRQIEVEGWTPKHDAEHSNGEIARAAAVYATPPDRRKMVTRTSRFPGEPSGRGDACWREPENWPWDGEWYKPTPSDRVRELVKAGALIAAEVDRLQAIGAAQ